MCPGCGCALGRMKMAPGEEGARRQRSGSRSQIPRGKMCSRVDGRRLLRLRKCGVVDDDRYRESVAVSVRDDDGVSVSAEVADHPIGGPVGRCSLLRGTCRKTLPDIRQCRLRHRGYDATASFP